MKKLSILFFSIITLAFSACSPRYYTPDAHSVPLITDKGEASLNLSGNGNRVEFQGAYGIGEKIAIKADGGLFWQEDNNDGNGGSGEFVEVGLGYFKQIRNHWVFETYGIVGFGSMENHLPSTVDQYPLTKGDISANILRYGIQPNFGFKSKYFTAAVSSRFVNLTYDNIKGDLIYKNVEQVDYLNKNSSNFLIRSEEHTSELQSRPHLVCRLLLEKKKKR